MNREEILEIFPEAGEAQMIALEQIFDRSAGELFALREQNAKMQAKLDEYAALDAHQLQQAAREKIEERFEKAVGGREFVHEFVRGSVLADFIALVEDEANAGRSDKELLAEVTDDKGCFVNRYQVTMGSVGEIAPQDLNRLSDAEYYEAFRMKGVQ